MTVLRFYSSLINKVFQVLKYPVTTKNLTCVIRFDDKKTEYEGNSISQLFRPTPLSSLKAQLTVRIAVTSFSFSSCEE